MLSYRVAQGVTDFVCEHARDNFRSGNGGLDIRQPNIRIWTYPNAYITAQSRQTYKAPLPERRRRKCGFVNPAASSYTSFDGTRTFKSFKYTLHINTALRNPFGNVVNRGVCCIIHKLRYVRVAAPLKRVERISYFKRHAVFGVLRATRPIPTSNLKDPYKTASVFWKQKITTIIS